MRSRRKNPSFHVRRLRIENGRSPEERLACRTGAQRTLVACSLRQSQCGALQWSNRKDLASSLASAPSLGYLVPYERIELLGSETTTAHIFSQAERPEQRRWLCWHPNVARIRSCRL